MEMLYLRGYKWLFFQNHRVINDFFGYRRYEALAKHIKLFLKNIKVKGYHLPDCYIIRGDVGSSFAYLKPTLFLR